MTTAAIILAAGKGLRAGGELPKQYQMLGGKALVARAVDHFQRHAGVDRVIIIHGEGQEALLSAALGTRKVDVAKLGGILRQDSVRIGLAQAKSLGCTKVLIHDAARPCIPTTVIDRLLEALTKHDAATPALPVVDTVARGDDELGDVVDRAGLFRIQTPQAFSLDAIMTSHARWDDAEATDDAQIARKAGYSVAIVAGDLLLEKVTHEADFARMEALLDGAMISRTGMGYDVHRLADGEELWLCGVQIPHSKGLAGHSDADVMLHALTDALLGAIGAGDIGMHFPPSDPQWRGASSDQFAAHAAKLVAEAGYQISNVDLTLICEEPKIGPYRNQMRERVAQIIGVDVAQVNIKATTTEQLGYTGRGEGMASQAIATVHSAKE